MRGVQPAPAPGPAQPAAMPVSPAPRAQGGGGLAALLEAARTARAPAAPAARAVTVRLPASLLERVDRVVFETGITKQDFFARALEAALEAVEAALPERR
jgi:hypothetical protein